MRTAFLALFIPSLVLAADDADSKKLLKDLEGTYKVTAAELGGGPPAADFLASIEKVEVKGNKFSMTFKLKDKSETSSTTITIDAGKKPAQIDLTPDEGDKKDGPALGIVIIDGDTVKICYGTDNKRPLAFETSKKDKNLLLTLKKVKN